MVLNLVVNVNECSFNLTQPLESRLQRFSDVVRLQQGHVGGQHDVDLDQEVAAEVERTHGVDVRHLWMVIDGNPC